MIFLVSELIRVAARAIAGPAKQNGNFSRAHLDFIHVFKLGNLEIGFTKSVGKHFDSHEKWLFVSVVGDENFENMDSDVGLARGSYLELAIRVHSGKIRHQRMNLREGGLHQ